MRTVQIRFNSGAVRTVVAEDALVAAALIAWQQYVNAAPSVVHEKAYLLIPAQFTGSDIGVNLRYVEDIEVLPNVPQ